MYFGDTITIALIAVFAYFVLIFLYKWILEKKTLPNGPYGLPFLGYTPFLTLMPHLTLTELSKKYGSVFSLKLGSKNVVVLNDWESIKDAFSKDELLARPENAMGDGFLDNPKNIVNGSGTFWKLHKRMALRVFRDLGFGKETMERNIKEEIAILSQKIDEQLENPINIHNLLISSVSNNILYFLFGHHFDEEAPIREKLDALLGNVPRIFQIPFLISIPSTLVKLIKSPIFCGALKDVLAKYNEFERILDDEIQAHEQNLDDDNTKDYFNKFLVEKNLQKLREESKYLTNGILISNAFSLIGAGSETVRTTLDWILKQVAFNTELQSKVHKEIDSVIGSERLPSWSDRELMPLTQAVILETQRWASVLPLNLPRSATTDTTILGHSIPKGTIVVANFWAINRNPKLWDNPDEFNPYRFLTKDGKLKSYETFIPFSYGKRSCVGEIMAKFELFLYFSILMQKYEISIPKEVDASFDMWLTIALQPTQAPILWFKKRGY